MARNYTSLAKLVDATPAPTALLSFAKTGKAKQALRSNPVLAMNGYYSTHGAQTPEQFVVYKKGRVIAENTYDVKETLFRTVDSGMLAAIELGAPPASLKSYVHPMLLNGDDDIYAVDASYADDKLPKVSFACLRRLGGQRLIDNLINGTAQVLDFTVSNSRKATEAQQRTVTLAGVDYKNALEVARKLTPPTESYTPELKTVYNSSSNVTHYELTWHEIGAVLIRDVRKSGKVVHYYCGRDEGTYFGVELAGEIPISTLKDALKDLKPKQVRGLKKSQWVRQGEWFFVEIPKKQVKKSLPSLDKCIAFYDQKWSPTGCFVLPLDDAESNHHTFTGNYRVTYNGDMYVGNGVLKHVDHMDTKLPKWYRVYKNTAVQAVSVEGVD
jgi:hypothetical protein